MDERDSRTIKLVGEDGLAKLKAAKVLVVGVGGVGSYAAEAIARVGIGTIAVMDGDEVARSNLNRQLVALTSTIGKNKAEVMAERMRDVNPDANITAIPLFYKPGEAKINLGDYDFVIDAIDDVEAKIALVKEAKEKGINIISAMGAAGKMNTEFKVSDISKTTVCPLAKVVRKRLREEGIEHLPVVFSEEKPIPRDGELGSISYVPSSMGLTLAGYVIKEITK